MRRYQASHGSVQIEVDELRAKKRLRKKAKGVRPWSSGDALTQNQKAIL